MTCIKTKFNGRPAFLCIGGDVYSFEGFRFENHSEFGPINIHKKTDECLVKQSQEFFEAAERWQELPDEERETYRVERN